MSLSRYYNKVNKILTHKITKLFGPVELTSEADQEMKDNYFRWQELEEK